MRKIFEIGNMDLPLCVLEDVNKRITDWLASGGKEADSYIQKQIEYAERVHSLNQDKENKSYGKMD